MELADLLAFADELADDADRIALSHFGGHVGADAKADGSPVTAADRQIEAALRARITAELPKHEVLGEEEGGRLNPNVPTWVIDPIDATSNFMRGIPVFATLIGLVHKRRAVVGVASAPAMGERWQAAADHGVRCNGQPMRVSGVDALSDAQVLHGGLDWFRSNPRLWELLGRVADSCWRMRGFGDFWMHLLVAGGMAEVAFERDLAPWDVAALECIVTEAGGSITTWDGDPVLSGGSVLTTNTLLHAELRTLLAGADPGGSASG